MSLGPVLVRLVMLALLPAGYIVCSLNSARSTMVRKQDTHLVALLAVGRNDGKIVRLGLVTIMPVKSVGETLVSDAVNYHLERRHPAFGAKRDGHLNFVIPFALSRRSILNVI
jgi:hypothetical protein